MNRIIRTIIHKRLVSPIQCRFMSSYPPHDLVGMPALSPTMEEGTVQGWTVEVGGEIEASDIVCQIETDKAAVDFEATDDGFMALHLVEPGHAPVPVGTPIMILVEEEEDVAAFVNATASDFITEAPKEVKQEEPVAAPPTPPPVTATPPSPPSPTPAQTTPPPAAVTSISSSSSSSNAFANGLNKKQHEYVNKYGSTLLESINVNSSD